MQRLTLSDGVTITLNQPTLKDVVNFTKNSKDARTGGALWILNDNGEFILPKFQKSKNGEHRVINRFLDKMQVVGSEYGLAVCTADLPDDLVLMSDEMLLLSLEYLAIIDTYCKNPHATAFVRMSTMSMHLWNMYIAQKR